MKLGSLFSGIGAFELSATRHGITPVWASEIETSAIAITRRHFPDMKHLGDITRINGAELEPVDIITFGSPCTNLSQAGKQNGFNIVFQCWGGGEKLTIDENTGDEIPIEPHFDLVVLANDKQKYFYETVCPICGALLQETNESALFFNAARVISEMREATNGVYPRFIIWENVPGAYSSNEGEDFRQVLEEICNIAEGGLTVPRPYRGKWKSSGGIVLDGSFSLAWRTLDAQYFGVAQRRRRIFLIADFGSERAGEILFVERSVSRNSAEGGSEGETVAPTAGNGTKAAGFNGWRSVTGDIEYEDDASPCIQSTMPPNVLFENHPTDSRVTGPHDISPTVCQRWGTGGGNVPLVLFDAYQHCGYREAESCGVLQATQNETVKNNTPLVVAFEPGIASRDGGHVYDNICGTLRANPGDNQMSIVVGYDTYNQNLTGDIIETLCGNESGTRKPTILCVATQQGGAEIAEDLCPTITAAAGMSGNNQPVVCIEGNGARPSHKGEGYAQSDVMYTLNTIERHAVAYAIDRAAFNQGANALYDIGIDESDVAFSLTAKGPGAVAVD